MSTEDLMKENKELKAENEKIKARSNAETDVMLKQGQEIESLKKENERLQEDNKWLSKSLEEKIYNEDNFPKSDTQKLRSLLERVKHWVLERKYARALDKKDYNEELQWQNEYDEIMGVGK